MNTAELNINALAAASTALLGAEKVQILSELYVLLDNAEKIGEASGMENCNKESYDLGYDQGYFDGASDNDVGVAHDAGYDTGFEDGVAHGGIVEAQREDAYDDGYNQGFSEGYSNGNTDARADLGECPIVDQEWDCDEEGYLRRAVTAMMD